MAIWTNWYVCEKHRLSYFRPDFPSKGQIWTIYFWRKSIYGAYGPYISGRKSTSLYFGCLNLYFGCLNLYRWNLGVWTYTLGVWTYIALFGCLNLYFGCLNLYFGASQWGEATKKLLFGGPGKSRPELLHECVHWPCTSLLHADVKVGSCPTWLRLLKFHNLLSSFHFASEIYAPLRWCWLPPWTPCT